MRILYVEDNEDNVFVLKRRLERADAFAGEAQQSDDIAAVAVRLVDAAIGFDF